MADLLTGWQGICARLFLYGLLVVVVAGAGAAAMHRWDDGRYEVLQSQFNDFKSQMAAAGTVAQTRATVQAALDRSAKDASDKDYQSRITGLNADNQRLRDAIGARGRFVPAAPAATRRPDLACFKRADFNNAVDDFIADVQSQVTSGAGAVAVVDSLKLWATTLKASTLPK